MSVQLFLQVSAKIVGMVEHLSLEIQTQPTLPETPALGYLDIKEKKKVGDELAFPPPLPLQCNCFAWALRNLLIHL